MTSQTLVGLAFAGLTAIAQTPAQSPQALPPAAQAELDRATAISKSIKQVLTTEPKGYERNARLEKMVDELDTLKDPSTLAARFSAHSMMNSYYRGDDIDAGIIKHSTWLIDTGKTLLPDQRRQYGLTIVQAYVNMAEAFAGEGRNDEAIALLKRAPKEWADVPDVVSRTEPTLERYMLVGTPAAAVTAPRWINAPEGTTSMSMKGHVTLLEFTAHWCGPCRESYPGITRLRSRFESRGFRVVLATQLYGYFGAERPLEPAAEIDRDRAYLAEHGMTGPVAVGDRVTGRIENGQVIYSPGPNPNDVAYKVGGIPQIQLIDKQGVIRLIMVGYDDANEAALAKFIDKLLAEK